MTPYTCPRCDYKTLRKADIIRHFKRILICPCLNETQLQLTDEIKYIVIRDRMYHTPKETTYMVNNIMNNNIMNCYFHSPFEKIRAYTEYKNIKMISLDETINDICSEKKQNFDRNESICYNKLNIDDLLQILDDISSSSDPEYNDFNVLVDTKQNKLSFVENDGKWKVSIVDKGLSILIAKIKESLLDYYECYLIRQLRQMIITDDLLREYYKFIAVFNLDPLVNSCDDSVILENDDIRLFTCQKEYAPMYKEIKADLNIEERTMIRQQTIDIIKRNSCYNEDRLSMELHNIFAEEEDFKKFLSTRREPRFPLKPSYSNRG
jgi:hypothetical protein